MAWLLFGAACIATLLTWSGGTSDRGHDVIVLLLVAALIAAFQGGRRTVGSTTRTADRVESPERTDH